MNERQKYALDHPVTIPFDTTNVAQRYMKEVTIAGLKFSTILTVENYGGETQWHASIAWLGKDKKPRPMIGRISAEKGEQVMLYLFAMLDGVGEGQKSTLPPSTVYHVFRALSSEEKEQIKKTDASNN